MDGCFFTKHLCKFILGPVKKFNRENLLGAFYRRINMYDPGLGVNLAFYRRQSPLTETSLIVNFLSAMASSMSHPKLSTFVKILRNSHIGLVDLKLLKRELWEEILCICRKSVSDSRRNQYSERSNLRLFQVKVEKQRMKKTWDLRKY